MSTHDRGNHYPSQSPENRPSAEQLELEKRLTAEQLKLEESLVTLIKVINKLWQEYTGVKYTPQSETIQHTKNTLYILKGELHAAYLSLKIADDRLKEIKNSLKDNSKIYYGDVLLSEPEINDEGSEYTNRDLYDKVHCELHFFRTQFNKIIKPPYSTDGSLDKGD